MGPLRQGHVSYTDGFDLLPQCRLILSQPVSHLIDTGEWQSFLPVLGQPAGCLQDDSRAFIQGGLSRKLPLLLRWPDKVNKCEREHLGLKILPATLLYEATRRLGRKEMRQARSDSAVCLPGSDPVFFVHVSIT